VHGGQVLVPVQAAWWRACSAARERRASARAVSASWRMRVMSVWMAGQAGSSEAGLYQIKYLDGSTRRVYRGK
jgi:hypothetical protein